MATPELRLTDGGTVFIKTHDRESESVATQACGTCKLRNVSCSGMKNGDAKILIVAPSEKELRKITQEAACKPTIEQGILDSWHERFG